MDPPAQPEHLPVLVLLGTAVGDALGLKGEGLPRAAARRLDFERGWLFGRAVFSDDTEQSYLTAQSLLASGGDPARFRRSLRRRLIGWLMALPPGVGLGTARSILRLMVGSSTGTGTAGNGAAMRSAIIGAAYPDDVARVEALVLESTTLTHNDARAFAGAFAVALAAGASARGDSAGDVLTRVRMAARAGLDHERWTRAVAALEEGLAGQWTVPEFAAAIGCADGVSGYVYDTVPVALYAWARHTDPELGLRETWACGGDTDTVGAIAGALLYAKAGRAPPDAWLRALRDWPLSTTSLRRAGERLAAEGAPVRWAWPLLPLRNLCVLVAVLIYGLAVMTPRKLRARLDRR